MLSARVLSMIDAVCREIRRNARPFGGLQTILVGDFFQLPPVSRREEDEDAQESFSPQAHKEQFAFFSPVWNTLNPLVCYLSEQHRQEDAVFLEFLSAIRRATIAESHRELLRTRYSAKPKTGITQLYSHNVGVNEINDAELAKLVGDVKTFEMTSRGPEKLIASLKRGCLSPELLSLKIGARVMFTKNDITTHRYVNGTLGIVMGFADTGYPTVKTNAGRTILAEPDEWHIEDGGRVLARITQISLRLAWAMTVHKSQGMSLDAAHMDLSDTFEYGQGYVALSRVRTLAGLSLAGLNARALEVHPEILAKDAAFRAQSQKSREAFSAMPKQELETLHSNFIRACGGKPGVGRKQKVVHIPTLDATRELVARKLSLKDIAKERGMTVGTIVSHLEKLADLKQINPFRDLSHIKRDPARFEEMGRAFEAVYKKEQKILLSSARELLGEAYSYDEIRLARLLYQRSV